MSRQNKRTDWNRIERLYRAGILSIAEIAREGNVPESNIRYHAKTKSWKRDLTSKVREASRIKMIENLATARALPGGKEANNEIIRQLVGGDDETIVEQAARTQVQVVREHQKTLGHGHSLTMRMLDELDTTTAYKGELQELITSTVAPIRQEALRRAVSLNSRATIMRDLATAARLWVTLERQAFSIADDKGGKDTNEQRKLDEMTAEQLREEIVNDANRIGLKLTREDLRPQTATGIVPKVTNGTGKVH